MDPAASFKVSEPDPPSMVSLLPSPALVICIVSLPIPAIKVSVLALPVIVYAPAVDKVISI